MLRNVIVVTCCALLCAGCGTGFRAKGSGHSAQKSASKKFSSKWKVAGRMYFEKADGENSIGTVTLGNQVRKSLKRVLNVQTDTAESASVVAIARKNGLICIESEKDRSESGMELHATLLGADPQFGDGHGTLQDVYEKLPLTDHFTASSAPTLEQIAKAYDQLIEPGLPFSIMDIIFWDEGAEHAFVATLSRNENCEITNGDGEPVSATLNVTLANVDQSLLEDRSWIESVLDQLQKKLLGKNLRVAAKNGEAKLEFYRPAPNPN